MKLHFLMTVLKFLCSELIFIGNVIILLEDSGSVTFLSNGFMPSNDESRLLVYSDTNLPQNFSSHVQLVEKIKEIPKSQPKIKKYSLINTYDIQDF